MRLRILLKKMSSSPQNETLQRPANSINLLPSEKKQDSNNFALAFDFAWANQAK